MRAWGGGDAMVMLICAAALAPLGLWFLLIARRQRSGTRPYCAACDYALHGLPDGTTNCPECGADITSPAAVIAGRRQRDLPLMIAGAALLLPALVAVALMTARSLRTAAPLAVPTATTPAFRPPPLAVAPPPAPPPPEVSLTDSALVAAILAGPTTRPTLEALLREASGRAKANTKRAPWVAQLLDTGMKLQADPSVPFPLPWAKFIESLQNTPHLPHEKWRQYLKTGVQIEATFRDTIQVGNPFPLAYRTRVRLSPDLAARVKCRMLSLSLGDASTDQVLRHDPQPADQFYSRSTYRFSFDEEQWAQVEPGTHAARLMILVAYQHPHYVNSTSDWIVRIERPITVLPKIKRELGYTAGLDEAVARSLRVVARPDSTVADGLRWDGKQMLISVHCDRAPTDIHAQVTIGIGTSGYGPGHAHWRKGESGIREFPIVFQQVKAQMGKTVKVSLIGSPANAETTLESGDWWVGTVRFDGVTVIDATNPVPPESLAVPEVQVHRPGTKVRPYGYYPVVSTRPAE